MTRADFAKFCVTSFPLRGNFLYSKSSILDRIDGPLTFLPFFQLSLKCTKPPTKLNNPFKHFSNIFRKFWKEIHGRKKNCLIYDKRDDFNLHITNFPFLSSNIPYSPAYGVFISQLIRYARACSSYECFILRAKRLSSILLKQGYLLERLKSSFRKFYGLYGDLIQQYAVTLSRMTFWPLTNSDFPTDQTFHQFHDLYTNLDLHRIMNGFHGAFATGLASQQGMLTLPDTWFRPPIWDLLMLQLLRPNSSNLPCLYSTFHLEYPLLLSRFCLQTCFCSNCWDQIPRTCHVFTRLFTLNTPWYFLDFASSEMCNWYT